MEVCVFCNETMQETGKSVTLGEKGCLNINRISETRNDSIKVVPGQNVHILCRKYYTRSRLYSETNDVSSNTCTPMLRSSCEFDFQTKCLFCGKDAKVNDRKRGHDVYFVRSLHFQQSVSTKCKERNDDWAREISSRLTTVIDLPAADAVYHQSCNVNFRTGRQIPKLFQDSATPIKSPTIECHSVKQGLENSFQKIIVYLQDVKDVVSISDLVKRMKSDCGDEAYTCKHLKRKLIDHFGERIVVTSQDGKPDKVTLKETASSIIHGFEQNEKCLSDAEEKIRIIKTAAKLIKADINDLSPNKDIYPSNITLSSMSANKEFVPESLQSFLSSLIVGKDTDRKLVSIGQAIVQASRPRTVQLPVQIGLAVQLYHHFGSRFLIDTLSNLGFCSSYYEVQKFESSAAYILHTRLPSIFPGTFVQFVADNVDHDICTLDGNNTFHGMGMIACCTPGHSLAIPITRRDISTQELLELGKINLKYFHASDGRVSRTVWKPLVFAQIPDATNADFDIFSKVVHPFIRVPSWSGFMKLYESKQPHPGKSSVTFLPMIDMPPTDLTCITSTLHFVFDLSQKHGVVPVLTFDQPLFQKATYVIDCQPLDSPLRKIVLRLGGFHTQMSFLGSIGHIMTGSGLQEVLEAIYASNSITHMLTGKAVSRAVRGHILVDTVLHILLLSETLGVQSSLFSVQDCYDVDVSQEERNTADKVKEVSKMLSDLYTKLSEGELTGDEVCKDTHFLALIEDINTKKSELQGHRTAQLWFQYMEMVSLLQDFIRAERMGDWNGHLVTLNRMLPYFAASGHFLYLKSAYTYLQKMLDLKYDNPQVYDLFMAGNHVVRRTDKFWAGLSTDLVIEQVLMRSLKSVGGLTRGRGMDEHQRLLWLMSMPAKAEVNNAMMEFSNVDQENEVQHDASKSRTIKDSKDISEVLKFMSSHNPFSFTDMSLRNIVNGVTASSLVNVDSAREVGQKVVDKMIGQTLDEYSFKKSCQVVTLSDKSSTIKLFGETVHIDPQLLFQRLTTAAGRSMENISEVFKFELCSIPSSMFDSTGLFRQPNKSTLAEALWKLGDCSYTPISNEDDLHFIIDGGSLLQKISWTKDANFETICQLYVKHLKQNYTRTTVVFDGYSTPSTKDVTHLRRTRGVGTNVVFSRSTPCRLRKDIFLGNVQNKQNFIILLGDVLQENEITVNHSSGDADLDIVRTAVKASEERTAVVIGEDTDLLVLLCFHAVMESKNILFRSDKSSTANKKCWDIKKTKVLIGDDICKLLPFLHAMTGCDTTSALYNIGKPSALKVLINNQALRKTASEFLAADTQEAVIKLGEDAIVILYEGLTHETLDLLRFRKFSEKVISSKTCVQVKNLPPTSGAAKYHVLRVYYQLKEWIGIGLDPLLWGWQNIGGKFFPRKTDLPAAPEHLLKIIKCSCKNGKCESKRCSCRKHGLECTVGCTECRGVSCCNSTVKDVDLNLE